MLCPNCEAEYREGYTECNKCGVSLIENLHQKEESKTSEFVDFVTVLETGNPATISLVKSILESGDIVHYVKGEALQNLFAGGTLGIGFNPVVGPVEIQVDKNDETHARELLARIEENPLIGPNEFYPDEDIIASEPNKDYSVFFKAIVIGAIIAGAAFFIYYWNQNHKTEIIEYDLNTDSIADSFYLYEDGVLVKTRHDRNGDGQVDDGAYCIDGDITRIVFLKI